jgi:transposase
LYRLKQTSQAPTSGKAMTPEQQEIQSLKKQLWRAKRDNEILKKATALFAMDNQ